RVANIQGTLKNLHNTAMIYSLGENSFEGLCTYADNTAHESMQPHIDKLKDIAGDDNVVCIVRTSDVPTTSTSHYSAADQLERKDWCVAVYCNERRCAVDMSGVTTIDDANTGTGANSENAPRACSNAGKRLPSVEGRKAINDTAAE